MQKKISMCIYSTIDSPITHLVKQNTQNVT